ncbi:MAG: isoprenyl transferase [Rhodothermales bacterium]|nr:isoprenyl transferase [Rhodothermales bacterium]MDG2017739.1 isoprenyl transferase [Rhodothermales bacterium]
MNQPLSQEMAQLVSNGPLPEHIAIIMDGNGRWAKKRGRTRVHGHKNGVHAVRDVTEACAELGIPNLTLYTFSTENWSRPLTEVNALMQLLIKALKKETATFHDNNIRLRAIGDVGHLPKACQEELEEVIEDTSGYSRMTMTLALSYSGRWEITEAMKHLARRVSDSELTVEDIDQELISDSLSTSYMPDPDLLIRTGGEYRVSNFLLWQLAYTELHFSAQLWPDFRRNDLFEAIRDFQSRERRFGSVDVSV